MDCAISKSHILVKQLHGVPDELDRWVVKGSVWSFGVTGFKLHGSVA